MAGNNLHIVLVQATVNTQCTAMINRLSNMWSGGYQKHLVIPIIQRRGYLHFAAGTNQYMIEFIKIISTYIAIHLYIDLTALTKLKLVVDEFCDLMMAWQQ